MNEQENTALKIGVRQICKGCSLVTRPSHHPAFDHLQYAKMEGEGGILSRNDISVYLGRQRREGGSPIERMHFVHAFFVLN